MCAGLEAPRSYREASEEDRSAVSNGCGPQSALFDVVPDHLLGLPIGCACDIHDWMYHHGQTEDEKVEADVVFHRNMKAIVEREGGLLRVPRLILAWWYWRAVHKLGDAAFGQKG